LISPLLQSTLLLLFLPLSRVTPLAILKANTIPSLLWHLLSTTLLSTVYLNILPLICTVQIATPKLLRTTHPLTVILLSFSSLKLVHVSNSLKKAATPSLLQQLPLKLKVNHSALLIAIAILNLPKKTPSLMQSTTHLLVRLLLPQFRDPQQQIDVVVDLPKLNLVPNTTPLTQVLLQTFRGPQ
jgi:hypothetical protein